MSDRDRDHEDSVSSQVDESPGTIPGDPPSSAIHPAESPSIQHDIDLLFGTPTEIRLWEPARPPPALGELLDSRYMLPLLFPSDPRMLAAVSADRIFGSESLDKLRSAQLLPAVRNTDPNLGNRSTTQTRWRSRNKKVREVGVEALRWVDGNRSGAQWPESFELPQDDQYDQDDPPSYVSDDANVDAVQSGIFQNNGTPLTRKPSARSKGRQSMGGTTTPVDS